MSALVVAVRIARRDALRNRARSLLIVVLIALPVMAGVALDVLARSGSPSRAQQVHSELAGADAWVTASRAGGSIAQGSADATLEPVSSSPDGTPLPVRPASDVLPLLPAGSQITLWQQASVPLRGSDGRYRSVTADLLDITSPAAGDRYRVTEGAAPTDADQVALTAGLAAELGLRLGDTVTAGAPAKHYTLAGLLASNVLGGKDQEAIVALPDAIARIEVWFPDRYLVVSPVPITWSMVEQLNTHGVLVYSRAAMLDPNAPLPFGGVDGMALLATAGGLVIVIMAILQVVFLAGPAFAVGARRMRRQLGQLVAGGAAPRQVRSVVLASGLVLGIAGSLVGVVTGILIALAVHPLVTSWVGLAWWGLNLHWVEIVGITAIGVGTSVLAALIPAMTAGRAHPVALLGRTPPSPRSARWWSLAGAIGCGAGVLVTIVAATRPVPTGPGVSLEGRGIAIAAGVLLTEIGLMMATPLLLQIAARLGAGLPTTGRLALRDAARHRGRTAPAIAAIMAATSAAVAATMFLTTIQHDRAASYVPGLQVGQVNVQLGRYDRPGADTDAIERVQQAVAQQWPGAPSAVYRRPGGDVGIALQVPVENQCPWYQSPGGPNSGPTNRAQPTHDELTQAATDWRCTDMSFSHLTDRQAGVHTWNGSSFNMLPNLTIGGPELRQLAAGIPDPAADHALTDGGAVVLDRRDLSANGTVGIVQTHYGDEDGNGNGQTASSQTHTVPAVLGRWSPVPLGVVLSPKAAASLGLQTAWSGVLVSPTSMPTTQDVTDFVQRVAATSGVNVTVDVERGTPPFGNDEAALIWVVLAIACLLIAGTVAVVTALGIADSRPDLATLAAIGARPRTRRLLSGFSAGLVTALGCVLGGLLGLVPAYGLLTLMDQLGAFAHISFAVPWTTLLILACGLPLAAFAVGAGITRSRPPMVARID